MKKIVLVLMIFFSGLTSSLTSGLAQVGEGGAASFGKQSQSLGTPEPPKEAPSSETPPNGPPPGDNAAKSTMPDSAEPLTPPAALAPPTPAPLTSPPLAPQSEWQRALARPLLGIGLGTVLAAFGLNADQSSLVSALLMVLILAVLLLFILRMLFRKPVAEAPVVSAETPGAVVELAPELPRAFVGPAVAPDGPAAERGASVKSEPAAKNEAAVKSEPVMKSVPVVQGEPVITPAAEPGSRKAGARRETVSGREAAARRKAAAPLQDTAAPAFLRPAEATRTPEATRPPEAMRTPEASQPPDLAPGSGSVSASDVGRSPETAAAAFTAPHDTIRPLEIKHPPTFTTGSELATPSSSSDAVPRAISAAGSGEAEEFPAHSAAHPSAIPASESAMPAAESELPAVEPPPRPPGVPAEFDVPGFLAGARSYFLRLQSAWDRADSNDIRQFTSPDMFEALQGQLHERGAVTPTTEVLSLEADLLGLETIADLYLATVRFTGTIKEAPEAPQEEFNEVWNLSRPVTGDAGWVLAGIQQLS